MPSPFTLLVIFYGYIVIYFHLQYLIISFSCGSFIQIENGEIDDPRPPVDCKERLMFFGSINNEVPAEDV